MVHQQLLAAGFVVCGVVLCHTMLGLRVKFSYMKSCNTSSCPHTPKHTPSAVQQQPEALPFAPGGSAAALTPGHKLGPPRAVSRRDQAHLGAQQHGEAHFLAVRCPGDLAIHHRRLARLCVCIARAHSVHLHICATSCQELLVDVGPLPPAGTMALSSLGLRGTVCTLMSEIPVVNNPLKTTPCACSQIRH